MRSLGNHIIEAAIEVVKVEGGVAIFLSEHLGNCGVLEPSAEDSPLVTESDHIFDTFLTLLLEQCEGGGLGQGV